MFQVSWKNQLVLAVVLFVFGSVVYWHEFKHKPLKTEAEEQTKKIFNLKETQIHSIKMFADGQTFEFSCADVTSNLCKPGDNSKWQVQTPMKVKGDSANINSLVSTLNNLIINESVNLAEETTEKKASLLKEYGLDEASRKGAMVKKIEVKTSKGETVLYLGQTHPVGDTIFGLASGDDSKIYLVPGYLKSNLEHDLTYWREKKILTFGAPDVESFELVKELTHSKSTLQVSKKDGKWALHEGSKNYAGDAENIDSLLASLGYLSAKNFTADNKNSAEAKKALAGAKPAFTFTLKRYQGEQKSPHAPVVLKFFEKEALKKEVILNKNQAQKKNEKSPSEKILYLTVSDLDPLYEIDYFNLSRLNKEPKDLRLSKLITSMDRFGAKTIEFKGKPIGDVPMGIIQKDGKWVNKVTGEKINQDQVQGLLDKISGNKIKDFLSPTPAITAGEKDGLTMTLSGEKGENKRQFVFWKNSNKLYGRDLNSVDQEIYLVDHAVQEGLPWSKDFFKTEPPVPDKKAK